MIKSEQAQKRIDNLDETLELKIGKIRERRNDIVKAIRTDHDHATKILVELEKEKATADIKKAKRDHQTAVNKWKRVLLVAQEVEKTDKQETTD